MKLNRWKHVRTGEQSITTPGTVLDRRRAASPLWEPVGDTRPSVKPKDLTPKQAAQHLQALTDPGQVAGFLEAEQRSGNRRTVIDAARKRLHELQQPPAPDSESE